MRIICHQDPNLFAHKALPMLLREEAINNWTVGFVADLCSGVRTVVPGETILCTIERDDGQTIATAASSGESLVLSQMNADTISELAQLLESRQITLRKTSGPEETVREFAALWAARSGMKSVAALQTTIMQLHAVKMPTGINGTFRQATAQDVDALVPWAYGFCAELAMEPGNPTQDVQRRIERKRLYVWCNPQPVSMAATAGPTLRGMRINFVYTPPEFRQQGYARACVANLSQSILAAGKQIVFLFVDARNPLTNRLYRAIGYEPVCQWEDRRFDPVSPFEPDAPDE